MGNILHSPYPCHIFSGHTVLQQIPETIDWYLYLAGIKDVGDGLVVEVGGYAGAQQVNV